MKRENTALSTELTDGAQRHETTQKTLQSALERDKIHKKEIKALSEQLEGAEKVRIEMQKKIELESTMRENKHKQLLDSINLSQRSDILFFGITILVIEVLIALSLLSFYSP